MGTYRRYLYRLHCKFGTSFGYLVGLLVGVFGLANFISRVCCKARGKCTEGVGECADRREQTKIMAFILISFV